MALFFGDSRCRIKNLSLNEIEFDIKSFATIMESLQFCQELVILSYSESSLSDAFI